MATFDTRVVVIGAGAAGLCMAVRLKQEGHHDFVVLEAADGVGGTWRHNTYPGAGCDVPSHVYSFSFAPNPDWSRMFALQDEILAYFEGLVPRFRLGPHLRFRTRVTGAVFEDDGWTVSLGDGTTLRTRILVSGLGQLNRPAFPDIDGRDTFGGPSFHSAQWDHEADLTGRVGVIGTGASALQLVPPLAETAASVTIFQRSPNWIMPRLQAEFGPLTRWAFRTLPGTRWAFRSVLYGLLEARHTVFTRGGLAGWITQRDANRSLATVKDPDLREALTPDYALGCKRILISNEYYDAVQRDHVHLVTDRVTEVQPDGVLAGSLHELDSLIWATGFHSTAFLAPLDIRGRDGALLADVWADGATAYQGMTVPGFPNFFVLYGPNTNLGHHSILFMIECQVNLVLQAIDLLQSRATLEVRDEALQAWDSRIQAELKQSVWASGCNNWYILDSGRNTNNWPGTVTRYWWETRILDASDYQ